MRRTDLRATTTVNPSICYFRHALALDERRVKFLPEYVLGGQSYVPATENPMATTRSSRKPANPAILVGDAGAHDLVCLLCFILHLHMPNTLSRGRPMKRVESTRVRTKPPPASTATASRKFGLLAATRTCAFVYILW